MDRDTSKHDVKIVRRRDGRWHVLFDSVWQFAFTDYSYTTITHYAVWANADTNMEVASFDNFDVRGNSFRLNWYQLFGIPRTDR